MLEQLEKIDGVEASSANHSGTMLRISVQTPGDREKVAEAAQNLLTRKNRNPIRLNGDELTAALGKERWRTKEQIGELSAIEFRTLPLEGVKDFLHQEKIPDASATRLLKIAAAQWDRLAQQAQRREPCKLPNQIDWNRRCKEFASAFTHAADGLLTPNEQKRFHQFVDAWR